MHQCIQRAELTAVISALWWIKGHVGSYIFVVSIRLLLIIFVIFNVVLPKCLLLHMLTCGSKCGPSLMMPQRNFKFTRCAAMTSNPVAALHWFFCRQRGNCADHQAEIANMTPPGYSDRVWSGFCDYRRVWKEQVKWYSHFVVQVAARDCSSQDEEAGLDSTVSSDLPVFEVVENSMHVTSELSALGGRKNLFTEVDRCHFKAGFHRLVALTLAPLPKPW
jgi:hypothetical protein